MLNVPGGTPQGTSPASARQLPPEAERPGTRAELQAWIRQHLNLPQKVETELNAVIDLRRTPAFSPHYDGPPLPAKVPADDQH